jgi:hypothetical protein
LNANRGLPDDIWAQPLDFVLDKAHLSVAPANSGGTRFANSEPPRNDRALLRP